MNDAFLRKMADAAAHGRVLHSATKRLEQIRRLIELGQLSFNEIKNAPPGSRAYDVHVEGFALMVLEANEVHDGLIHRGTCMVYKPEPHEPNLIILPPDFAKYVYQKVTRARN